MRQDNRIWLLSEDFPSPDYPTFVFVEQLVFALVDIGVPVSVIAPQSLTKALVRGRGILPKKSKGTTAKGNKFDIFRPYTLSFGNHLPGLTPIISYLSKIGIKRILEKKYKEGDVLYGHFWSSGCYLLPFAVKHQAPLFVACGEGDDAMEQMASRMTKEEIDHLKQTVCGVISVSTENKRKSIELGFVSGDKVTVLPNCVDDSIFKPYNNIELKKTLGIRDNDFTLAFVGAFIKRKGSKVLSDAICSINNPRLKSIFVGGPLDNEDCSPTCDGIVFQGKVSHNKLPELLACADAFVLPTQREGCSNAIVEALACGIPVISSNRPFNDDILNDRNAILVDPDNEDEVADAIRLLMEDKEKYKILKDYVLYHACDYSLNERAKKIIDFINAQIEKVE